jgi:hypothetical protein
LSKGDKGGFENYADKISPSPSLPMRGMEPQLYYLDPANPGNRKKSFDFSKRIECPGLVLKEEKMPIQKIFDQVFEKAINCTGRS